jgi:hypothetical protein
MRVRMLITSRIRVLIIKKRYKMLTVNCIQNSDTDTVKSKSGLTFAGVFRGKGEERRIQYAATGIADYCPASSSYLLPITSYLSPSSRGLRADCSTMRPMMNATSSGHTELRMSPVSCCMSPNNRVPRTMQTFSQTS